MSEKNAFELFHEELARTAVLSQGFKDQLSGLFQHGQREAYERGRQYEANNQKQRAKARKRSKS